MFTHSSGNFGYNAIIFGVNSPKNDNMLALGIGNIKCNNKTINVTAPYSRTNISATRTKTALSLDYNKQNSPISANGEKITDFIAKDSEINNDLIYLGDI